MQLIPVLRPLDTERDWRTIPVQNAEYWGDNDCIPKIIHLYSEVINIEDQIYSEHSNTDQERINFRARHPRELTDKMRLAIKGFRKHHCFYEPVAAGSQMQRDLLRDPPGTKAWVDAFIAGLSQVPLQDLDVIDRKCPLCHGQYEQDAGFGEDTEQPLKLPCGHISGSQCLAHTVLRKSEEGGGFSNCTLCQARIYVPVYLPGDEISPSTVGDLWENYMSTYLLEAANYPILQEQKKDFKMLRHL